MAKFGPRQGAVSSKLASPYQAVQTSSPEFAATSNYDDYKTETAKMYVPRSDHLLVTDLIQPP